MVLPYSKKGQRIGAIIIDSIIVNVIVGAITLIIFANYTVSSGMLVGILSEETTGIMKWYMLLGAIGNFAYFTLCENGTNHATLGKRVAKIKVVSANGEDVSTLDVLVRNAIRVLPALLSVVFAEIAIMVTLCKFADFVYYIVPLCNKSCRTIHDFIAGTAVVEADYVPAGCERVNEISSEYSVECADPFLQNNVSEENFYTQIPQFMKNEYKLVGLKGEYEGARFPLDEPLILGRKRERCNVLFRENAKGVSRVHCEIGVKDGQVYMQDLGSTYGAKINDTYKVDTNQRTNIEVGSIIAIGKELFRIE